jgi:hypothetical protein
MEHSKKKPIVDEMGYFIGWRFYGKDENLLREEFYPGKSADDEDDITKRGSHIRPKESRSRKYTSVVSGVGGEKEWID